MRADTAKFAATKNEATSCPTLPESPNNDYILDVPRHDGRTVDEKLEGFACVELESNFGSLFQMVEMVELS